MYAAINQKSDYPKTGKEACASLQSPIESAMNQLAMKLEAMIETITHLEARLDPVLSREESKPGVGETAPDVCRLFNGIYHAGAIVSGQTERLNAILNRLQV